MIWVNNMHLLLVPMYIKRHDIHANIGFYLHTPFPSSDIFRTSVYRMEIMKSLLCCDVVGFHIFEYARNFMAVCQKLLKLEVHVKKGGFILVEYHGRNVSLKVNHVGINMEDVQIMIKSQDFLNFKYQLSQLIQYKKVIIASVDSWHPLSGIKHKLEGYQLFLKTYPPIRKSICLI